MESNLGKRISARLPRPISGIGYAGDRKVKRVELLSGKQFEVTFVPTTGSEDELIEAAYLASLPDRSPEAQAIYFGALCSGVRFNSVIPEEAESFFSDPGGRFSGMNISGRMIRKGALEIIERWILSTGGAIRAQARDLVAEIRNRGNHAIVVADHQRDLGVIEVR